MDAALHSFVFFGKRRLVLGFGGLTLGAFSFTKKNRVKRGVVNSIYCLWPVRALSARLDWALSARPVCPSQAGQASQADKLGGLGGYKVFR